MCAVSPPGAGRECSRSKCTAECISNWTLQLVGERTRPQPSRGERVCVAPIARVLYLPGSSVKGLVRAWAERDAEACASREHVNEIFGSAGAAGQVIFLSFPRPNGRGPIEAPHASGRAQVRCSRIRRSSRATVLRGGTTIRPVISSSSRHSSRPRVARGWLRHCLRQTAGAREGCGASPASTPHRADSSRGGLDLRRPGDHLSPCIPSS